MPSNQPKFTSKSGNQNNNQFNQQNNEQIDQSYNNLQRNNSQNLITNHAQNRRLGDQNFEQNSQNHIQNQTQNHNYSQVLQNNYRGGSHQNWFQKWLSRPDLTVPIITCVVFTIFFFYNFGHRTGGKNSDIGINSFSLGSSQSLTERRIFREILTENTENTVNHILIIGQSLSVGETGSPALKIGRAHV